MSVQINPSHQLSFRRPLTQLVKRTLTVHNPHAQPVAFKVKTTAPKLYCVRPNSGRIEPGETVDVQVMLQAMKEEPPLSAKCKDKFLIQSTYITPAKETLSLQEIWNQTDDSNEESKVHQQKVKVNYAAAESTIDEEDELQANLSNMMSPDDPNQYRNFPPPELNGAIPHFDKEPPAQPEIERAHTPPEHHEPAPPRIPTPAAAPLRARTPPPPAPAPAPAPVPVVPAITVPIVHMNGSGSPGGVPTEEHNALVERFTEAQNELQRMRALLQAMPDPSLGAQTGPASSAPSGSVTEVGLRRRARARSDASSTYDGSYVGTTAVGGGASTVFSDEMKLEMPEGVPLQVVIMVALGVFVTTYLFF